MEPNKFCHLALGLVISVALLSCKSADRGGVTLTPKVPIQPAPAPDIKQKEFSIVSFTAKCIEIRAEDYYRTLSSSRVQAQDCIANRPYQSWYLTTQNELLSTNGQCLALSEPKDSISVATATSCDGTLAQKWQVDPLDKSIRNQSIVDYCLDSTSDNFSSLVDGVKLFPCDGKEGQQWEAVALDRKQIGNVANPDLFINVEPYDNEFEHLKASRIFEGWWSTYWTIEPVGSYFRIRSFWQPAKFLNIEYGNLQSGPVLYYWQSAQWSIIKRTKNKKEVFLIRNVWKNNIYIGLNENLELVALPEENLSPGSSMWYITNVKSDQ